MQETQVQSLGHEDPLEEEMATRSGILPRESHGQRSLAAYRPQGRKQSDTTEATYHARTGKQVFLLASIKANDI